MTKENEKSEFEIRLIHTDKTSENDYADLKITKKGQKPIYVTLHRIGRTPKWKRENPTKPDFNTSITLVGETWFT